MDGLECAVYECVGLEYRQKGRRLSGRFPYGATATVADRGTVRKERFSKRAFSFALNDPERTISLLRGHDFDKALAVRSPKVKSLELEDTDGGLNFEAVMPPVSQQPTHLRDTLLEIQSGLLAGLSPGFKTPPRDVVPDAENFVPEPGNPGVEIRVIQHAVLFELSLVHRPAYKTTSVELRGEQAEAGRTTRRRRLAAKGDAMALNTDCRPARSDTHANDNDVNQRKRRRACSKR